jgi:hypothetical protein
MKKFNLLALLLIILGAASAKAQVSIGTENDPHAGAILDLQSTAKGLLLPHVELQDLEILQVGGSSAEEDLTATGMIVYNISPNFCQGVYAWNGRQWRKLNKDYQVRASALNNLEITEPEENDAIVGGEAVTFEATPGNAKFYSWYLNDSLLATTPLPTFTTTAIREGVDHKMKVVLDDCLSLSSAEITFNAVKIFPTSMPTTGGVRWIRIYNGNDASPFPYAAIDQYVSYGLVAHFDGINNIGEGDKAHDFNAPAWKDLRNDFSIPRSTGDGQWLSNGFQALDDSTSFYSSFYPAIYPSGNASRTVEVIFRTPDELNMFVQKLDTEGGTRRLFLYGVLEGYGALYSVLYRGRTRTTCKSDSDEGWIFYPIAGNVYNMISCLSSTPALTTHSTINTVTSTYQIDMNDALTNSYINNTPAQIIERTGSLNTNASGFISIGENLSHSTFLSLRLYDRVLTATEIQHNAALDQMRYLAPPVVTIGDIPCTNVTVLSPRCLTCQVPSTTTTGTVKVNVFQSNGTTPILEPDSYEFTYTAP